MQDIFGDECPSKATIYRWIERFDNGDKVRHDDPLPGRPTSSTTRRNIEEDRRITLRELEERVGISKATLHSIITEDLEMSKRINVRGEGKLTRGVLLQHDNARSHVSSKTMAAIDDFRFEYLPHPPHSPDLATSGYWLFREMKRPLRGKRFEDFKWLEYEIIQWENGTPKEFHTTGL
ncbi:hypothetical protein LOD99_10725 [Oopsacas minuta]|uniref:Transposase n=1 Tax=Oopsacas minuta TaxID=111878 RepID=A0AAV7KDL8_9METZ|nr:hypothetical protein LOD99_10725 [Oopsacas minuta]